MRKIYHQQLTLFAEDSHVKTYRYLGNMPDLPEPDRDCGSIYCDLFAKYHRDTSSWKTSQRCVTGGYQPFLGAFTRSGMMRNGIAYRLPTLVPAIGGTEYGSLLTPSAQMWKAWTFRNPYALIRKKSCGWELAGTIDACLPADDYARMRGNYDGVSRTMDRLKALGNSVAPQIPEIIGMMILEYEKRK